MRISEIVIASFDLKGMKLFYEKLLNIAFTKHIIPQGFVYEAQFENLKLTLCPAKVAGTSATENRQQLTFHVLDLNKAIEIVEQFGGQKLGELKKSDKFIELAIRDIDNNSLILRQEI